MRQLPKADVPRGLLPSGAVKAAAPLPVLKYVPAAGLVSFVCRIAGAAIVFFASDDKISFSSTNECAYQSRLLQDSCLVLLQQTNTLTPLEFAHNHLQCRLWSLPGRGSQGCGGLLPGQIMGLSCSGLSLLMGAGAPDSQGSLLLEMSRFEPGDFPPARQMLEPLGYGPFPAVES